MVGAQWKVVSNLIAQHVGSSKKQCEMPVSLGKLFLQPLRRSVNLQAPMIDAYGYHSILGK